MNYCPYCKKPFEYKDILFFIPGRSSNIDPEQRTDRRPDARGNRFFDGNMELDDFSFSRQEQAESDSGQEEESTRFGEWAPDQIYYREREPFWRSETTEEMRFIVRWHEDAPSHGVAQVTEWHTKAKYPTAVRLCEDDAAESGWHGSITKAICPNCHFELPTDFLWVPDENCHSIALIGYPSSGKTQYKLSLIEELDSVSNRLREVYNMARQTVVFRESVQVAKQETRDGTVISTDATAVVLPMIFAIERDDQAFLITLYDLPGEVYKNEEFEGRLVDHMGLRGADGAILMVDPVQLYNELDGHKVKDSNNKDVDVKYVTPQASIFAPLAKMKKFGIGQNLKYLALVVTKADLLISEKVGTYFKGVYLRQLRMCHSREYDDMRSSQDPGAHMGHFGMVRISIINKVDEEVMHVIDENPLYNYRNVKREICDEFSGDTLKAENIRAFVISTLRRQSPDNPDDVEFAVSPQTRMPRHRILEPLLYLLARWGVVKCDGDAWGPGAQNPFPKGDSEGRDGDARDGDPEPLTFWERLFGRRS